MTPTTHPSAADRPTVAFAAAPQAAARPALDAARLWSGGMATAVVATLVAMVGVLVVRVLAANVPQLQVAAGLHTSSSAVLLCTVAAIAALVATAVAHLLLVSTPRPMAYLGWIVGLATAAAAVLPLTAGLPLAAAVALGVIDLVIGLAIGSLVTGTVYSVSHGTHVG